MSSKESDNTKLFLQRAVLASLERGLQKRHLEPQVDNYRRHLEQMVAERTGQLQAALRQIERSYEDTLQALGVAIDLRDNDGGGYPLGIKGEAIFLSSRIFAVADTLDAITSNRPYRRASSFELASETICALSGSQFDPQTRPRHLSIPEDTWPAIAGNQRRVAALSSPYPGPSAAAHFV
jgi:hypothetical protein